LVVYNYSSKNGKENPVKQVCSRTVKSQK